MRLVVWLPFLLIVGCERLTSQNTDVPMIHIVYRAGAITVTVRNGNSISSNTMDFDPNPNSWTETRTNNMTTQVRASSVAIIVHHEETQTIDSCTDSTPTFRVTGISVRQGITSRARDCVYDVLFVNSPSAR